MSTPVPIGHPDSAAFQSLQRRVDRLEGGRAADDDTAPDVRALADRVDRHRLELDELKRRYNHLARYVERLTGNGDRDSGNDQAGSDSGTGS